MKILLYGINYHPELTGCGKYSGEMAEWFAEHGHQVRVVTTPPYYPQWRISDGFANRYHIHHDFVIGSQSKPSVEQITVYRCPVWLPSKKSGLLRLAHLSSFAISSFPLAIANALWKPDVILLIAPTFFCAVNALAAARLCGSKTCLHIQDFELDAALELGMLHLGILQHFIKKLEGLLMDRFDRVSTISDKMLERLEDRNIPSGKCIFFPNWVDTDLIHPIGHASPLKRKLSLPENTKIALYSGNMNFKQGLEILADCARLLSHRKDLIFVFCGDGPARNDLAERTRMLANVQLLPLQPLDRLNDILNLADIHLLPQKMGAADLVMPSKLTGMLASGRPVVATAAPGTQVAQIVETCGKVVSSGDSIGMVQSIEWLLGNTDEAKSLGEIGRNYALENWSKERVLSRFENDLLSLCQA